MASNQSLFASLSGVVLSTLVILPFLPAGAVALKVILSISAAFLCFAIAHNGHTVPATDRAAVSSYFLWTFSWAETVAFLLPLIIGNSSPSLLLIILMDITIFFLFLGTEIVFYNILTHKECLAFSDAELGAYGTFHQTLWNFVKGICFVLVLIFNLALILAITLVVLLLHIFHALELCTINILLQYPDPELKDHLNPTATALGWRYTDEWIASIAKMKAELKTSETPPQRPPTDNGGPREDGTETNGETLEITIHANPEDIDVIFDADDNPSGPLSYSESHDDLELCCSEEYIEGEATESDVDTISTMSESSGENHIGGNEESESVEREMLLTKG